MAQTNAEHQAAFRRRQKDRIARLEEENARLRQAAKHDACDALERDLRDQIERLLHAPRVTYTSDTNG